MSADNGIYIAKFPDGYRVTDVVQCIENVDYHRPNTKARKKMLTSYFGNSPVFQSKVKALLHAGKIYNKWTEEENESGWGCPIEYGISFIGEYESFADAAHEPA